MSPFELSKNYVVFMTFAVFYFLKKANILPNVESWKEIVLFQRDPFVGYCILLIGIKFSKTHNNL